MGFSEKLRITNILVMQYEKYRSKNSKKTTISEALRERGWLRNFTEEQISWFKHNRIQLLKIEISSKFQKAIPVISVRLLEPKDIPKKLKENKQKHKTRNAQSRSDASNARKIWGNCKTEHQLEATVILVSNIFWF